MENDFFSSPRMATISSLLETRCFRITGKPKPKYQRLFRSRFIDKVKSDGTKRFKLCVTACNNRNNGLFTAAPTVKWISFRLFIFLAATEQYSIHTRDVTKAFISLITTLQRPVYMEAHKEMSLDKGNIFKVLRPVYGMPDAPMHWFETFIHFYKSSL